jgi:Trk K+ transport system NAD-binding subunit
MRDPFLLVCGYGETGSALIRAVTERHQHAVAIDIDEDRVNALKLENLREFVPALTADASRPQHLMDAGLEHPLCRAVVALTNDNDVNLKIAITSKLLHPDIRVICRADSHDVEANMNSFGTDFIVDPYDEFARHLATALHTPGLFLLQEWLTGVRHQPLREPIYPPTKGRWIVCGYGRFGRAICQHLKNEGLEPVVVEATPEKTGTPEVEYVVGRGTEADTLQEAGIEGAVGLVAGTDKDSNNLSIIMTAKDMKTDLFVVARQNMQDNQRLFEAVQADMVMHPSAIIANRIRVRLATPLLYEFASQTMYEDDGWACELISRITALVNTEVPEVWEVTLGDEEAHAVCNALPRGQVITLGDMLTDSRERERKLPVIPLLLLRNDTRFILPADETRMKEGDQLLLCGTLSARGRMEWTLQNEHALSYVLTGQARPQGWIWKLLHRREWGATG